jgi:hypothetical protein
MYAVYTHDASTTQANLVNDIVLILTGTTNTASLSADCVTASSSITTTYDSAGWTLHDGSTGATSLQIIKALQQDGVTYKYVGINATSTTSFKLTVYEDWNATTHVGTNGVDSNSITWSSSTQQPFYIYASIFTIAIALQTTPSSNSFSAACCALEVDNTLGTFIAGYPTTFTWNTGDDISQGAGPRIKNPFAVGDLLTTSTIFHTSQGGDSNNNVCKGRIYRDGSEVVCMGLLTPLITAGHSISATNYGAFGKLLGKMKVGSCLASAVTLDTVVISATTYIAFRIETGGTAAGTSLWVPQG